MVGHDRTRNWGRPLQFALAFAIALAATANAFAGEMLAVGTRLSHELALDGKVVPLPKGPWVVAVDAPSAWSDRNGGFLQLPIGAYGYMRTVLLFRIDSGRVDTVVEVNSNVLPADDGWGVPGDCGRPDMLITASDYKAGWDGSCHFVTHTLSRRDPPAVWQQASAFAAANGWALSDLWLTAGFRAANRSDVVDIRFHFAPENRGFAPEIVEKWQDSLWANDRIEADPARAAWRDRMGKWATAYSGLLELGLKSRLPADLMVPSPDDVPMIPADLALRSRMASLEALQQGGTITPTQYQSQLDAIHKEGLATSSAVPDATAMAGIKSAAYRATVTISHMFVNIYWTGAPVPAGIMEVLQVVINSTKFYFHELAWARYAGGQRADTARTVDFDYISMNQPTLTTSEKLVNWTYNLGHISKVGAQSAGIFFAGMYDYAVNGTGAAVGAAQNAVGYASVAPATGTVAPIPTPGSPAPALTQ